MMVHIFAISILLLPIVTASGDEFWDDVDMINKDLSDPEYLPIQETYEELSDPEEVPTLETTTEAPLEESMLDAPHQTPSSNENEEHPLKRQGHSTNKFRERLVTLRSAIIENFKRSLIIVESSSRNISRKILEDKLQALGRNHYWPELETYKVEKYPKYWANVCVTFWNKQLERIHRVACKVSRSFADTMRRILILRKRKHYFDLLYCRCYTYITSNKIPLCIPDVFLINKGNNNEFFIFQEAQSQGRLSIKGFKDGITLPNISASGQHEKSSDTFVWKMVTLNAYEIETFNQALTINTSYPQNASMGELEEKLIELEDIHEWPDLFKYDYKNYTRYWAKVCVFFWGKQLDMSHRQSCMVHPSLGYHQIRTLLLHGRTKFFDLLLCKCHSYITTYKTPVSEADTFLIHQSSDNEFFVFDQRASSKRNFTLFIKDFKGGITLPDPDDFN